MPDEVCHLLRPRRLFVSGPQWTPAVWSSNSTELPFSALRGPVSAVLDMRGGLETHLGLVWSLSFSPLDCGDGGPGSSRGRMPPRTKARSCDPEMPSSPSAPSLGYGQTLLAAPPSFRPHRLESGRLSPGFELDEESETWVQDCSKDGVLSTTTQTPAVHRLLLFF